MSVYPLNRKMPFKCDMCHKTQLKPPAYLWVSDIKALTNAPDMKICKQCAIREHGKKNRTPLDSKTRMEDKEDG